MFILLQVLDKTLKGIRGVRLDNQKFIVHQVLGLHILSAFFCCSINYYNYNFSWLFLCLKQLVVEIQKFILFGNFPLN